MRCPRCDNELGGRPAKCDQCKGCWVSAVDVHRTMKTTNPAYTDAGPSKIACPECYATMQAITYNNVHLDRCAQHGVWFDIGEITDMLRTTGKLAPAETAKQDQPSTAAKVGAGAAAVGVGILDVMSDVLDIVM